MSKRERPAEETPNRPAARAAGDTVPAATPPEIAADAGAANEPLTMQLIQEHLDVNKQWVEAGAVVIKKVTETAPVTVPVELAHDEVEIQRIPVGRVLADDEAALPRQEDNTWIIPVIEEELVVSKRRVVREEWRITRQQVRQRQEVQETVRRDRLQVDTSGEVEVVSDEGVPEASTAPGM